MFYAQRLTFESAKNGSDHLRGVHREPPVIEIRRAVPLSPADSLNVAIGTWPNQKSGIV